MKTKIFKEDIKVGDDIGTHYGGTCESRPWHKGPDFLTPMSTVYHQPFSGYFQWKMFPVIWQRERTVQNEAWTYVKDRKRFKGVHLFKPLVKNGYYSAGTPIALTGNSGRSTGPHTHCEAELWVNNKWVWANPYKFILDSTNMIESKGKITLKSGDVTIYDGNTKIVKVVQGGTVNDYYAVKDSKIKHDKGSLMFALTPKLDRWVHIRSLASGNEIPDTVISNLKAAQDDIAATLQLLNINNK